jgi:hypothetical protein
MKIALRHLAPALPLGLALAPAPAHGQHPAGKPALPSIELYAMATATLREYSLAKTIGFTGGAVLQTRPHWSTVEEASMTHWHSTMHSYSVLVGPRWGVAQPHRFQPYVQALGGIGHAGAISLPAPVKDQYGVALGAGAGLTWRINSTLSVRVLQASINHTFAGRGWTCQSGSAGFVVRTF